MKIKDNKQVIVVMSEEQKNEILVNFHNKSGHSGMFVNYLS